MPKETGIPASGAAEQLPIVYKDKKGNWHMPRTEMLSTIAERFRVKLSVSVRCKCQIPETLGPVDPVAVYYVTPIAQIKRLKRLRKQRKRAWRAAILRRRAAAWLAATKKLVSSDESPFSKKHTAKREKALSQYRAHRLLYPLPDVSLQPTQIQDRDERMNRYVRDRDNGKRHETAANGAEAITHSCEEVSRHLHGLPCQCSLDWRPFVHWRPWDDVNGGGVDLIRDWELKIPEAAFAGEKERPLLLVLKRILWVFRSSYPDDEWRTKRLFYYVRVDENNRRFQLRSWHNGIPLPHQYAKPWECYDFKRENGTLTIKINLDHTLVKREHRREKKVPGYTLHDSWRDVMAYLNCSRRTAFRKIKEGFRIPK